MTTPYPARESGPEPLTGPSELDLSFLGFRETPRDPRGGHVHPSTPSRIPPVVAFTEKTGLTRAAQRQIIGVLGAMWVGHLRRRPQPLKKVFCQTTHRHLLMACGVCAETMLLPADADGTKCKMTPKCDGTYTKEVALEKSA